MSELAGVTVHVIDRGRTYLYMRYIDPSTGEPVERSSGKAIRKDAVKEAAKWEAELREGRYKSPSKVTWSEFRTRYEDEHLNTLAEKTAKKAATVLTAFEELSPVDRLAKLDATKVSKFQEQLRKVRKLSEASVKVYLAHLHAALKWAKGVDMLASDVPKFTMPKRAKGAKLMKGRAITREEFDRMSAKIPEVVAGIKPAKGEPVTIDDKAAEMIRRWEWSLLGLWFSGLRIGEAVDLSWDESGHIQIDLSGKYPMFVIPGDKQKSGDDQLLPIAPEFAEMVKAVPVDERTGRVFKFGRRNAASNLKLLAVSRLISQLGEKANVVVNKSPQKFASAHDFRRAFGELWSTRVMPTILQQMMRHADIDTTMKYYVGQNSQKAAADIYAAFATTGSQRGDTLGDTKQNQESQSGKSGDTKTVS